MPLVKIYDEHTHHGKKYYPGQECLMTQDEMVDYNARILSLRAVNTTLINSVADMNTHDPAAGVAAPGPNAELSWNDVREAKKEK